MGFMIYNIRNTDIEEKEILKFIVGAASTMPDELAGPMGNCFIIL